jgi:hypothetical protein
MECHVDMMHKAKIPPSSLVTFYLFYLSDAFDVILPLTLDTDTEGSPSAA